MSRVTLLCFESDLQSPSRQFFRYVAVGNVSVFSAVQWIKDCVSGRSLISSRCTSMSWKILRGSDGGDGAMFFTRERARLLGASRTE